MGGPSSRKIVLIGTGGTIASRFDPARGRTLASECGAEVLAQVPRLAGLCALEIDDFATVSSFDISVGCAFALAQRIGQQLAREDVAGVVVTHGTDTMEESCYLADLLLSSDKPVVFTGAQRPHDDPLPDGPDNLLGALRTALAPAAVGLGAVLCFARQIHAARDVSKRSTSALAAFESPGKGPLGAVDGARVIVQRRPAGRASFALEQLPERRVPLFRLTIGFDVELLELALGCGLDGLVIEAFGAATGRRRSCRWSRARPRAAFRW